MKTNEKIFSKSGVTLISLVITIIVLIILSGISIATLLGENGIISKSKEAKKKAEIEEEREILIKELLETSTDKDSQSPDKIPDLEGWSKTGLGRYWLSPRKNWFTISDEGKVVYEEEKTDTLLKLEELIIGKNKQGKKAEDICTIDITTSPYTIKIKNNEEIFPDAEEKITFLQSRENGKYSTAYFMYKENPTADGEVYKIVTDVFKIGIKTPEELQALYNLKIYNVDQVYSKYGREGEKVTFDIGNGPEEWTILYDYGDTLEIISPKAMGNFKIGNQINVEKEISNYNYAILSMNNYCDSLVKNPSKISVRSVGSNPKEKNRNEDYYEISGPLTGDKKKYNGKIFGTDNNYEQDLVRMIYHNVLLDGDNTYWLASRNVSDEKSQKDIDFNFRVIDKDWSAISNRGIMEFKKDSDRLDYGEFSHMVRPIVKVRGKDVGK